MSKPLTRLFNLSLTESFVPSQWKTACITPVPKIAQPTKCEEYRPISITPVLSRVMEKLVVRNAVYPVFKKSDISKAFADQYAFRPTGSTTAALISVLRDLSELSQDHPYVQIIALDFSKAFDTVRHYTMLEKIASLPIPDFIYNWIVHYVQGRSHCTKSQGVTSAAKQINASVVQGSALGPVTFIINASDLKVECQGNKLHKYADDTYLIVPFSNGYSIAGELAHIEAWAKNNNLRLNTSKSLEMVVRCGKRAHVSPPPPIPGVERVTCLNILGVTIRDNLSMSDHVQGLVSTSAQSMYAIKVLKAHGMSPLNLNNVCRATLISKMVYAAPAWHGYLTSSDTARIQSVFNRATRWGIYLTTSPDFADIINKADQALFNSIIKNNNHVLHTALPPTKSHQYNLRNRSHNLTLPLQTTLTSKNFFHRMLYKDSY